jgi:hypothetical protein
MSPVLDSPWYDHAVGATGDALSGEGRTGFVRASETFGRLRFYRLYPQWL